MSSPQTSSSSSPQDPDPPPQSYQSDSQEISLEDYGDVSVSSQSQPSSKESQTSPEIPKNLHHPPRKVIVYSRRHILNLSSSPLVQRPEGMPALKDWFGDWSEQHPNSQTKKDTSDTNNTSGNRRFPRRDQDEGGDTVFSSLLPSSFSLFVDTTRTTFRSTLSQPSQMGNFRHQSIRGDLTRNGGGDRDKENDRDKEGHERLRSLSDMYDRERFGLPSSTTTLIRTQPRESSGHHPSSSISGSTTTGRLTGRERIDRDRDKDSTRRSENREPVRRKGGESIDWRRGAEASRFTKDDQSRGESERDRSPEVDRSRRERSTSRERWSERRGRDGDEKDKDIDKSRPREEDRKHRTKESESHSTSTTSNRWSERPMDEKRKSREENDKDSKEDRKDRDRDRRDRLREHPDAKRDRELREGWTMGEDRNHPARRAPGRGAERRTSGADEDKEVRKDREKDKEPAWMDDYIPEPNAPKAGIFGGKIEGMEDELQAWKRKQASTKQQTTTAPSTSAPTLPPTSNGIMLSSSTESLPRDGTVFTTGSITPNSLSLTTDEQTKASDAFFFGLMKGEGKAKSHNTTPAKSPEPEPSSTNKSKSPAPIIPLSSTVDPTRVDPAVISAAPQGSSKTNNPSSINPPPGASSLPPSHDTLETIHRSSPNNSHPVLTSFTPGPIGSSTFNNESSFKIPSTTPPISAPFNPPTQSRVLAFSQAQHRNNILSPSGQHPISPAGIIGSQSSPKPLHPGRGQPSPLVPDLNSRNSVGSLGDSATQRIQTIENLGSRSSFSPFDNGTAGAVDGPTAGGFTSSRQPSVDLHGGFNAVEALLPSRDPRLSPQTLLTSGISGQTGTHDSTPSPSSSFASGRGSRFAKFWEKSKEAAGNNTGPSMGGFPPATMLSQQGIPAPPQSVSPSVSQQGRQPDLGPSNVNGFPGNASIDNIQDMLAMLQNSQGARVNHRPSIPQHLHALHEQQIPHHQPQPQHHFSNANNILDHQFDNNRPSFVPDGLVPGLRPARNRDGSIYTSDGIDDTPTPPFSVQPRQGQGQQQQFDRQTPGIGGLPQIYNSQTAGGVGMGGGRMFQPPFRAEPSPLNPVNPNALQRLPPGLANLGGRPPHDPSAYLNGGVVPGLGVGMGVGGLDGPGNAVGGGAPQHQQQQAFNGFGGNANPIANFASGNFGGSMGMGGMGMSGLGAIGGMNVGASLGMPGGQRGGAGGGQTPLPIQTLLSPNGNAMLSPTGHHPEFTVQHHPQHPHHHHHPSVGVRGPPQGLQNQQPTPHGPPPPGMSGGVVRGAFGQPGAPGSVGLSPAIQAQLGLRQQQQQGHHMLPGMIPPPQMQHLAQQQQQQQPVGGLHGLHHGHGHGQTQNEHLLSMLMGGLAQRE